MIKEYFSSIVNSAATNLKKYNYFSLNIRLIIYVVIVTIIGINVIGSATNLGYEKSQIQGMIIGLIAMIIIGLINYNFILRFYWILYFLNLIVLFAVKFTPLGSEHGGAKRWLEIGGFQFQPAELSKLIFIIFFAVFLSKYREKLSSFKFFFISVLMLMVPLFLILKQPDLSTTIVIFLIFCVIMFIAGLSYKIIGTMLAIIIPLFAIALGIILYLPPEDNIIEKYQYERIIGFYDSENEVAARIRYQQENSVIAIGSGGLTGKGLYNDTVTSVKNGNYISEPQTDFIFTILGEEMGFLGTSAVIVLLFLISFECIRTGVRAPNLAGKILCVGFGSWIAFQSFINICVVTMLIPNTGIPLPFISYGQTSLVCLFGGIGMVINVSLQHQKIKFSRR